MNINEVKELIKLINDSDISLFSLKDGEFILRMDKSDTRASVGVKETVVTETTQSTNTPREVVQVRETTKAVETSTSVKEEVADENLYVATSPIVGTFYSSPSPDKAAYVKVGDKVKKGQTLCIIEAMKLMNEIESEVDGEVVEILAVSEDMVEYGQPLFKIRRA